MSDDASVFWSRVAIAEPSGCWLWTGPLDSRGYGNLRWGGGYQRAHRVAYSLKYGPIPEGDGHHGQVVMHRCDERRCCNPGHLKLGSHADNMSDMVSKGRSAKHAGTDNGRAVLTPDMVEAIRADQRGTRTIAKDYPVSRSAIQRIKTGHSWVT